MDINGLLAVGGFIVLVVAVLMGIGYGCALIATGYGKGDQSYLWYGLGLITAGLLGAFYLAFVQFGWFHALPR